MCSVIEVLITLRLLLEAYVQLCDLWAWPSKWHFHPDVSICMYPPHHPDEMQAAGACWQVLPSVWEVVRAFSAPAIAYRIQVLRETLL